MVMPRTCSICGQRLGRGEHTICTVCYMGLPQTGFAGNPYKNDMAKVFWGRVRNMEKAFAMIYYHDHSASAQPVYQLKYHKKADIGIDLGIIMGRAMLSEGFFDGIDAIVPVPLARKRLRQRGYNQSEMIAIGIHDVSSLPILKGVVRRVAFDGSQTKKDRWGRVENVENAFQLADGGKVRGRHVLIVDDVVTTGATICALAKQIERVGDVKISVAAWGYAGEWHGGDSGEEDNL